MPLSGLLTIWNVPAFRWAAWASKASPSLSTLTFTVLGAGASHIISCSYFAHRCLAMYALLNMYVILVLNFVDG